MPRTFEEMTERGHAKLQELREKYRPEAMSSGSLQVCMAPEEMEILLAAGCPEELLSLKPSEIRKPTISYCTPEQLAALLTYQVRQRGRSRAPASNTISSSKES